MVSTYLPPIYHLRSTPATCEKALGLSIFCVVTDAEAFEQIPKPNDTEGLCLGPGAWPAQPTDMEKLKATFEEMKAKM